MAATKSTKKNAWKAWHGFAIEIGPDTDLRGDGMLILELQAGGYEPIGGVCSVNEAQELAADRMHRTGQGMMPRDRFVVWARGVDGRFLKIPVAIDGRRK
jgi:hypothetical protein